MNTHIRIHEIILKIMGKRHGLGLGIRIFARDRSGDILQIFHIRRHLKKQLLHQFIVSVDALVESHGIGLGIDDV